MKSVEDEQEKSWVVDSLVSRGPAALPAVRRFIKGAEALSFPLSVLSQIADKATVLQIVDETFAGEPPGYVRHPERRIDLLRWLADWPPATAEEVTTRLTPYLVDFDENVRFAVIDGLANHDVAAIGRPLLEAAIRPEEESGRIRRRLLEVIAQKKVPLGEHRAALAELLSGPLAAFAIEGDLLKLR